jgi:hypothetical protein
MRAPFAKLAVRSRVNASEGRKVRSARQIGEEGDGEMRARKIIGVGILALFASFRLPHGKEVVAMGAGTDDGDGIVLRLPTQSLMALEPKS